MKFKGIMKSAVAIASAGALTLSPMTAFAQSKEAECTCTEKCTESNVNEECEVCSYDYSVCEGTEVEENYGPLTPDGNLTLVDDYGSLEAGGKQFITVTTKAGNYFYIIIDRDDNGSETVHFLNLVDESDLLSLMDDEEAEAYVESITADEDTETTEDETVTIEDEPVPGATTESDEVVDVEDSNTNVTGIMAVVLIAAIAGIGGYFYFTSKKKATKKTVGPDPDEDYDIDDEDDDILSAIPEDSDFSEDEILDDFDSKE